MSEAREKRNKEIRDRYQQLLNKGLNGPAAVDAIYNSPENERWCLERDTIRMIAIYKNYGKVKPAKDKRAREVSLR